MLLDVYIIFACPESLRCVALDWLVARRLHNWPAQQRNMARDSIVGLVREMKD